MDQEGSWWFILFNKLETSFYIFRKGADRIWKSKIQNSNSLTDILLWGRNIPKNDFINVTLVLSKDKSQNLHKYLRLTNIGNMK